MKSNTLVLCTSLFGGQAKYRGGALQCAQELQSIETSPYRPTLAIYYDVTSPSRTLNALSAFSDVELIRVDSDWAGIGTLASVYRFLGFKDYQEAAMLLTWDVDNTLTSGAFHALLDRIRGDHAAFHVMRKHNPPRGRLFNADCWAAVPPRWPNYECVCRGLLEEIADYFRRNNDTTYGCDERAQRYAVQGLFEHRHPGAKIVHIGKERLETAGQAVFYDDAQRVPMPELLVESWESLLAKGPHKAQYRTVRLLDYGFPSIKDFAKLS
jgi:hypothetical protein